MNRRLNLVLTLAAGLVGGLLSRYFAPAPVHAQAQTTAPREIRAQSFTLVDSMDRAVGTFTVDSPAPVPSNQILPGNQPRLIEQPRIVLRDTNGREIWSAGGGAFRRLSER